MNQMISAQPIALPAPMTPMKVRVGMRDDMPFMDRLQKMHSKALGFFPRAQMEGYIDGGHVLIATDAVTGERLGYVASRDRYLKRDELGVVFQLCVVPGKQRGLIGANLLREVFERSSYGCRLYCCWCAQDLPANYFWQSMGFVPIAYRAGSAKRSRVHIFWEKRIRAGDTSTPYWFPAKTEGGAIREDRIILPIPPGMRWDEALPVLRSEILPAAPERKTLRAPKTPVARDEKPPKRRTMAQFGLRTIAPTKDEEVARRLTPSEDARASRRVGSRSERVKPKADPALIAKARELRDRWIELASVTQIENQHARYDVVRVLPPATATRRLAA